MKSMMLNLKFDNLFRRLLLVLLGLTLLFPLTILLILHLLEGFKDIIILGIGSLLLAILIGRDHDSVGILLRGVAITGKMPHGATETTATTIGIHALFVAGAVSSEMSRLIAHIALGKLQSACKEIRIVSRITLLYQSLAGDSPSRYVHLIRSCSKCSDPHRKDSSLQNDQEDDTLSISKVTIR